MNKGTFRLVTIFFIIVFAGGLFLTVKFLKSQFEIAVNPSKDVIQANSYNFSDSSYEQVLKRINGN